MRILALAVVAMGMAVAQPPAKPDATQPPNAEQTRSELNDLLQRYPPTLHRVLTIDPTLLGNGSFLESYPALKAFVDSHPEVARNPSFYAGEEQRPRGRDASEMWDNVFQAIAIFGGFGMAMGLLIWLVRTLVDYRRWSRLAKVQTEAHTKLLDRFTSNEDLLAYIQSRAGSKFLESAPIPLDAGPRSVGAPMGRILWSVQGGVVLIAGGIGLEFVSARSTDAAAQPLQALGILAVALGVGFVVSAAVSFFLSRRLGLIEAPAASSRSELPGA